MKINLQYKQSVLTAYKRQYIYRKFIKATAANTSYAMISGDLISNQLALFGEFSPALIQCIRQISATGYADFLIDIGGNLGALSLPVADQFKQIHILEPNPLIFKLLEINTQLSLNQQKITLYPFGLADCDSKAQLSIPQKNWGGAFVASKTNFNSTLLAQKDGYKSFSPDNYYTVDIDLKDSYTFFKTTFEALTQQKNHSGIIKIDVEGMEQQVIEGLCKAIVHGLKLAIIFENWSSTVDCSTLNNLFPNCTIFNLNRHPKLDTQEPKLKKLLRLVKHICISGLNYTYALEPTNANTDQNGHTDIVIFMESK